jgi:hypothetical protein
MSFDWSKLKGVLGAALPAVASVIGTSYAGNAVKTLCNVLGLKEDSHPDEIANAYASASPEQLLQLKQLDSNERIRMEEIASNEFIQSYVAAMQDKASARTMNIEGRKEKDNTPRNLAYIITIATLLYFGLICSPWVSITGSEKDIVCIILGVMLGNWKEITGFYFGSSAGSRKKDEIISLQQK